MTALIEKAIDGRFMKDACRDLVRSFAQPDALLDYLEQYDGSQMLPEQMKFL